jgi:hypothetical protein
MPTHSLREFDQPCPGKQHFILLLGGASMPLGQAAIRHVRRAASTSMPAGHAEGRPMHLFEAHTWPEKQ